MSRSNRTGRAVAVAPPEPNYIFHAYGRYAKGGVLIVYVGDELIGKLKVPKVQWCCLVLLFEAALESRQRGWAKAYVTAEELGLELQRRTGCGDGQAEDAHRGIHKLRTLLNGISSRTDRRKKRSNGKSFGKLIVETHETLGYRLTLDPDRLLLQLLDEGESPEAPK